MRPSHVPNTEGISRKDTGAFVSLLGPVARLVFDQFCRFPFLTPTGDGSDHPRGSTTGQLVFEVTWSQFSVTTRRQSLTYDDLIIRLTPRRKGECRSERIIQGTFQHQRMDAGSELGGPQLQHLLPSSSGPLCIDSVLSSSHGLHEEFSTSWFMSSLHGRQSSGYTQGNAGSIVSQDVLPVCHSFRTTSVAVYMPSRLSQGF